MKDEIWVRHEGEQRKEISESLTRFPASFSVARRLERLNDWSLGGHEFEFRPGTRKKKNLFQKSKVSAFSVFTELINMIAGNALENLPQWFSLIILALDFRYSCKIRDVWEWEKKKKKTLNGKYNSDAAVKDPGFKVV